MQPQTDSELEKNEAVQAVDSADAVMSSQRQEQLQAILGRAADWLQPLRPSILNRSHKRKPKLRATAYLDGLRGFAAFLVYIVHNELWAHEALGADKRFQSAWGADNDHLFITLPFVRTFFTGGHLSVAVFFILSGYVLSNKPLKLIHAEDYIALGDNVASAVFRRWFRLYLPIIATTWGIILLYHTTGLLANFVPEAKLSSEFYQWYLEFKNFSFFLKDSKLPWLHYNLHTWTIPVEMKGSLVIYMLVMAFSRLSRGARVLCEMFMIYYFMYISDGAWYSLFTTGMLLCDLDILASMKQLPAWLYTFDHPVTWYSLLIFGLYIGGIPAATVDIAYLREQPGWYHLSFLKPQAVWDYKWFFLFWAGLAVVVSVQRIPWLKRFFESHFCQYLGRISYMLYLIHGPIMWTLGDRVYAACGWSKESHALTLPGWTNRFPLPRFGPVGLEFSFIVPNLLLIPITLWLAEIGTSLVDTPSIKFGTWLYSKVRATDRDSAMSEKPGSLL